MPLANELSAASGVVAYARQEPGGPVLSIAGRNIPGAYEPSLSDTAWLALRFHSDGGLALLPLGGGVVQMLGPGTRARWSSRTVVWEWAGRIYGRTTPDQPTVDLTIPGRSCSHPLPVWHAGLGRLFVLCVVDDGDLVCFEWGNSSEGWIIGHSGGSGFDWSARAA